MSTSGANARNRFDAFISYSRRVDSHLSAALKRELQKFARPWFRPTAANVFLDDTNLAANPNLWWELRDKISASSFLVLFASPEAAQSKWVAKELAWWLSGGQCEEPEAFTRANVDAGRAARTPAAAPVIDLRGTHGNRGDRLTAIARSDRDRSNPATQSRK